MFLFFFVASAFDIFLIFYVSFSFLYTLLLLCSVGCKFGCIIIWWSYGRRISFRCLIRMIYFLMQIFFLYFTFYLIFSWFFVRRLSSGYRPASIFRSCSLAWLTPAARHHLLFYMYIILVIIYTLSNGTVFWVINFWLELFLAHLNKRNGEKM